MPHKYQTKTDAELSLTESAALDVMMASKELKTNTAFISAKEFDFFYIYFFNKFPLSIYFCSLHFLSLISFNNSLK